MKPTTAISFALCLVVVCVCVCVCVCVLKEGVIRKMGIRSPGPLVIERQSLSISSLLSFQSSAGKGHPLVQSLGSQSQTGRSN